jgi:hypothetical protein
MISLFTQKRENGKRKKKTGLEIKNVGFDLREYLHTPLFNGITSCRGW